MQIRVQNDLLISPIHPNNVLVLSRGGTLSGTISALGEYKLFLKASGENLRAKEKNSTQNMHIITLTMMV